MTLVMLYEAYLFNCQNDDVEVVYVNAHCAKLDTLQRKQLKVLQISCRYNGSRKVKSFDYFSSLVEWELYQA